MEELLPTCDVEGCRNPFHVTLHPTGRPDLLVRLCHEHEDEWASDEKRAELFYKRYGFPPPR